MHDVYMKERRRMPWLCRLIWTVLEWQFWVPRSTVRALTRSYLRGYRCAMRYRRLCYYGSLRKGQLSWPFYLHVARPSFRKLSTNPDP